MLAAALSAALLGSAAPAVADPTDTLTAVVTAGHRSVTIDLSSTVYALPPTGLHIQALRNGCTDPGSTPCWSEQDAALDVSSDFNGVYTVTGLKADTLYDISGFAYNGVDQPRFSEFVTTASEVPAAPSAGAFARQSADGLHASVEAQAEYVKWNVNDGTPLASLRYNVYAYIGGRLYKKVLSNAAAGVTHTVSGLPLHKAITFLETDVNSVGESPSKAGTTLTLSPAAPGAFSGVTYTGRTTTDVVWHKPAAGAGTITRFVLQLEQSSRRVYSHTYAGSVRSAEITHLKRRTHYVVFLTAYNSYGVHRTIQGVLTTK